MAEWLRRGLQILARRFDSGSGLHIPITPPKGPHGRNIAPIVHSSDNMPELPPPVLATRFGRTSFNGLLAGALVTRSAAESGVIADASTAIAPAMTTTRRGEGDLPDTSLVPKRMDWIGAGDPQSMSDDRRNSDPERDRRGDKERDGRERNALIEAV